MIKLLNIKVKCQTHLKEFFILNKHKNYLEIHNDRIRQRSLENNIFHIPFDSYFKNREEIVIQNHKELFLKASAFKNTKDSSNTLSSINESGNTGGIKYNKSYTNNKNYNFESENNLNADLYDVANVFNKRSSNNKLKKKKKSKFLIMKKKVPKTLRNKKIKEKNGIIHLNKKRKKKPKTKFRDVLEHGYHDFVLNKKNNYKSNRSFQSSGRYGKRDECFDNPVNSVTTKSRFVSPISERLIMNNKKPYIFVGNASYTQRFKRNNAPQSKILTNMFKQRYLSSKSSR